MNNIFSLHWLDKNWRGRGYANHRHLIIDTDNRVYRFCVNYVMPNFNRPDTIEVVRKSDIDDYVKHLQAMGFSETEEEIIR